jgi:transcriptional regulator with XRE-family HTH domain
MIILTADRIKELRETRFLTQTELAKKLSVTRASVNAWEMGISVPTVDKVIDLASFCHVSTDYILGVDQEQKINVSHLEKDELELVHRMLAYFDKTK